MNKFYTLSPYLQWSLSILFLVGGMAFFMFGMIVFYPYAMLLHFPITLPVAHFAMTPFLTLIGVYKYYSPMLLVYKPSQVKYDIHSGTSFDYLMVMKWKDSGLKARRLIWCHFLQGFVRIAEEIEAGKLSPNVQIEGTSYFFSEQTAKRLGFTLTTPSPAYRFNLLINFVDLIWMYSFAQGKLAFPQVLKARKAVISGQHLLEQKAYYEQLIQRLSPPSA